MKDLQTERAEKLRRLGENIILQRIYARKRREAERRVIQIVRQNLRGSANELQVLLLEASDVRNHTDEEFDAEVDKLRA